MARQKIFLDFQEVKAKVSFPEVLKVLGLLDRFEQKSPTKLQGACPLPQHQHGPMPNTEQFKIDLKNGTWLWHCFGDCQIGGDVIEFVKKFFDYSDAHARLWFADKFGERLNLSKSKQSTKKASECMATPPTKTDDEEKKSTTAAEQPSPPAEAATVPSDKAGMKELGFFLKLDPNVPYLSERGISGETIERFEIGLAGKGLLAGYVAMPIWWHDGEDWRRVAYLGRWPSEEYEAEGKERYKLPAGFAKTKVVYGLKEALEDAPQASALIVVEGPFQLFHLRQAGFANTAAVLGSFLSEDQADILTAAADHIVLLFDGDDAGVNGMRLAAARLIQKVFVRVLRLPPDTQPNDLSPEEIRDRLSFLP